ncbi:MAG: OmpA family protein [Helicobacter sp.]|nr:OmpA family protein [Helicobacter sp.]
MQRDSEWISISDMMAGLMMIFLLITVSYMLISEHNQEELRKSNEELRAVSDKMSAIAEGYYDIEFALYHDLIKEFGDDLKMWNAEIDSGNTIRFKEPDVLFATGEGAIQQRFKKVLDSFFPRYIAILSSPKYRESIEEIRIEGHTSSEWKSSHDLVERYLENASLSQARAFSVLQYCFNLPDVRERDWLISVLRANGLSFAKPLETDALSRRVEFRTITKSRQKIQEIFNIKEESTISAEVASELEKALLHD